MWQINVTLAFYWTTFGTFEELLSPIPGDVNWHSNRQAFCELRCLEVQVRRIGNIAGDNNPCLIKLSSKMKREWFGVFFLLNLNPGMKYPSCKIIGTILSPWSNQHPTSNFCRNSSWSSVLQSKQMWRKCHVFWHWRYASFMDVLEPENGQCSWWGASGRRTNVRKQRHVLRSSTCFCQFLFL